MADTPIQFSAIPVTGRIVIDSLIPGGNIATAYFTPRLPPELEFETDRFKRF
jgi:hypothetical protein